MIEVVLLPLCLSCLCSFQLMLLSSLSYSFFSCHTSDIYHPPLTIDCIYEKTKPQLTSYSGRWCKSKWICQRYSATSVRSIVRPTGTIFFLYHMTSISGWKYQVRVELVIVVATTVAFLTINVWCISNFTMKQLYK